MALLSHAALRVSLWPSGRANSRYPVPWLGRVLHGIRYPVLFFRRGMEGSLEVVPTPCRDKEGAIRERCASHYDYSIMRRRRWLIYSSAPSPWLTNL
ncbi:hypothetical protein F5Y14DRAFT_417480 [Nemania sp. NC0429]|nr:hypothetical protein F5Y14DRAFT_417480 [Nemania sp. NC0429]